MKRAAAVVLLLGSLSLGACSTSTNDFHREGTVCYRTRTDRVLGVQTRKERVLAVDDNCGPRP